ncbi:endonuclease domain-containing protein [Allorhodopirellula solitaria]|uniref:endonuclease domain-containing protein n=1 Tax=Allorhodopirellula solitaria TaxID=2527987 RepID=UPI0011B64703|nr:endonuclease domain-containing protein [Allorhodopirellula solitaria]
MDDQPTRQTSKIFRRGRRKTQTRSEGLLWSVLRAKQLCGLKFRREHSIGPWFADFACVAKMLVVEIDGGYHDENIESDLRRQRDLEERGWKVLRFTDKDIEQDCEAVAREIAKQLDLHYVHTRRAKTGSGMKGSARPPRKSR